jgi:hypothetical protein
MNRFVLFVGMLSLGLSEGSAHAEIERTITSSRVLFGDLIPTAPPDIAEIDLGPAPPAGSSRLYSTEELLKAARQAGRTLLIRDSVRAVRATKRWTQAELLAFITPKLKAALPEYARLLRVEVPRTLTTVPGIELNRVEPGQLPNRRGTVQTSALFELTVDGKLEQRLTLPIVLDLGERPKPVEIERGTTVTLQISLGATRVSAAAVPLQTVAVGSVALFRVVKTRKTLRAKLLSPSAAEVVHE